MLYGDSKDLLLFDQEGKVVRFAPEQYFEDNEQEADELQEVDEEDVIEQLLPSKHVTCVRANPHSPDTLAIASRDKTVMVYQYDRHASSEGDFLKQLWNSRNVPNDDLDLMVPIWDKDCAWLSKVNSHCLATCTAFCEVREYDTRG